MEFIRIGENKIKLSLSEGDMQKYGIQREALEKDTTARRRALWTLLDEVKRETGIDAVAGRTVIEAFPGKKTGCEIFVTVLAKCQEIHTALYRFEGTAPLRAAVEKLEAAEKEEIPSSLYALFDGEYLLALRLPGMSGNTPTPYSFLEEYGVREKSSTFHAYAKEYGVCLYPTSAISRILSEKENFSV